MAIMSPRPSGKRRGPAPRKPSPGNPWPKKLRKLRDELDLTQEEAAAKAGVALRTWISWENDHRQPSGPAAALLRQIFPDHV